MEIALGEGSTVVPLLLTAITTLGGVIAFLYKQQSETNKHQAKKLDDCEQDREKLWLDREA